MTVTGEKKKRRRRKRTPKKVPAPEKKPTPEKKSADYTLVYKNPKPDPVKPRKKPKSPNGEPISFIMQQRHIYDDMEDDTL